MCCAGRGIVRHEEPHFLLILILLKTELLLSEHTGKNLLFLRNTQALCFWAHSLHTQDSTEHGVKNFTLFCIIFFYKARLTREFYETFGEIFAMIHTLLKKVMTLSTLC